MLWFVIRLIFKTSSVTPDFFYVFNLIISFSTCSQSFNKICVWEVLGTNVLKCHILIRNLFPFCSREYISQDPPRVVLNNLEKIGYKVIAATGVGQTIVWTLHKADPPPI